MNATSNVNCQYVQVKDSTAAPVQNPSSYILPTTDVPWVAPPVSTQTWTPTDACNYIPSWVVGITHRLDEIISLLKSMKEENSLLEKLKALLSK